MPKDGSLVLTITIPASSKVGAALAAGGELSLEGVHVHGIVKAPGSNVHFAGPFIGTITSIDKPAT